MHNINSKPTMIVEAKIIRANGKIENLGVISGPWYLRFWSKIKHIFGR